MSIMSVTPSFTLAAVVLPRSSSIQSYTQHSRDLVFEVFGTHWVASLHFTVQFSSSRVTGVCGHLHPHKSQIAIVVDSSSPGLKANDDS
jgi:hypothetical protein